jgi:hypothetical protein
MGYFAMLVLGMLVGAAAMFFIMVFNGSGR